ncbi:TPA: hypothetical protein ENS27_01745 [bacterium]|nr:hypothetical protein [bacterium]
MIVKKKSSIFLFGRAFFSASVIIFLLSFQCLAQQNTQSQNYDWPMWRYDANRSASSPQELPDKLYLQWIREYPQLKQAWEDPLNQDLMQFDKVYEPVVFGKTLFVGSSTNDRLNAIDTETGKEKWVFYADGPIRFSPIAHKDRIYFVSDDGYLYCLKAEDGTLVWKFRGGPNDRRILGNERLISTWPARGGLVLKDDIIYFASGIWPFMGVYIYAIEATSRNVIWANDSTGSIYMLQPHNSPSYAGVAPQGALVVSGDKLLVPCGRSVPACFDLRTGELLYYHLAEYNKTGGAFVCAQNNFFINYHRDFVTSIYDLTNGESAILRFGKIPVMTQSEIFCMGNPIIAFDFANIRQVEYEKEVKDSTTKEIKKVKSLKWVMDELWRCGVDSSGDLIKAGSKLYAGGKNAIYAIDVSTGKKEPKVSWKNDIKGTVGRIIAGDGKLFVVTVEGNIYAFGSKKSEPKVYVYNAVNNPVSEIASKKAESILNATGIKDGYCLAYGLKDGQLLQALADKSELQIIGIDSDPDKVEQLRKIFDHSGIYGKRISIQVGNPLTFEAPPYIASLTIFEDAELASYINDESFIKKLYHNTRPYGGIVCFTSEKDRLLNIRQNIQKTDMPKAILRESNGFLLLVKDGSLPGSGDWTHQYGDIANTVKSDDQLVKLPLGILWFGGSPNTDVLPRHGHGPPEQVIGGRLFIEGMDCISARDVYTGRILWKKKIPELNNFGIYYDETYKETPLDTAYNQVHIPGANARSTNFVATQDKIYVALTNSCLVLDSETGERINVIALPLNPKTNQPQEWGYIGVYKDYLIAGADFVNYTGFLGITPKIGSNKDAFSNYDITSSKQLIIMERHTGKVLWTQDSTMGFRHNAIAVGDDKIFCIDMLPPSVSDALKRRGQEHSGIPKLMAFDLQSGKPLWEVDENIFGTWLSYSKEYDVVVQATRKSRDMLTGEPDKGIAVYKAKDGSILWSNEATYGGPVMLHKDKIITDRYAYNLLTGKQEMRTDPLTGESKPWEFKRNYGCNYVIASEHLLTFRSAAAGFFDLDNDGGTGNFGGFKSGCTSNLIAADGVLNAPDYTRTCSCSYQNQASLAMIYTPDVEIWTDYSSEVGEGPIKSLGINFGAHGDRRDDNGTLWMEYPIAGGPSPKIPITINPTDYERFIKHSSNIQKNGIAPEWIVSSGIKGASSINIGLAGKLASNDKQSQIQERPYTIRLYFAEPDDVKLGQRKFDIAIQGKKVIENFDIVDESGSQDSPIIKEFKGIMVKDNLTIDFIPSKDSKNAQLICGIEIKAER